MQKKLRKEGIPMAGRKPKRNFVNELGFITSSSGAMSKKYLKDISYLERSTTSTSDKS
jgi:hypothetical protein